MDLREESDAVPSRLLGETAEEVALFGEQGVEAVGIIGVVHGWALSRATIVSQRCCPLSV
jgi:hypothetical protein